MSSLLAAIQESISRKGLNTPLKWDLNTCLGASLSKEIYAHDNGEKVAKNRQVPYKLASCPPQASIMVPQIHRFTPLKRGRSWDKFLRPFQSSPQARDARLEKSHLPNDFLMFVSSGEICHAFNLLQKKSGNREGFKIFKCSNIYFSVSVFITIMLVAEEISQDQELMLLSATNAFSIGVREC